MKGMHAIVLDHVQPHHGTDILLGSIHPGGNVPLPEGFSTTYGEVSPEAESA